MDKGRMLGFIICLISAAIVLVLAGSLYGFIRG